jgi:hypothetical protein
MPSTVRRHFGPPVMGFSPKSARKTWQVSLGLRALRGEGDLRTSAAILPPPSPVPTPGLRFVSRKAHRPPCTARFLLLTVVGKKCGHFVTAQESHRAGRNASFVRHSPPRRRGGGGHPSERRFGRNLRRNCSKMPGNLAMAGVLSDSGPSWTAQAPGKRRAGSNGPPGSPVHAWAIGVHCVRPSLRDRGMTRYKISQRSKTHGNVVKSIWKSKNHMNERLYCGQNDVLSSS